MSGDDYANKGGITDEDDVDDKNEKLRLPLQTQSSLIENDGLLDNEPKAPIFSTSQQLDPQNNPPQSK